jgi:tetratricopeptide (TPR) repeat protein
MAKVNWLERLGWDEDQLDEVRILAYAYIRQGKYDIALPFFEMLSILLPDSAYDAQTLGALHLELGNPAKSLRYFDRALKLEPNHAPTLLNLAKALMMLGNREEGLKVARVLKANPDPYVSSMAEALLMAFE